MAEAVDCVWAINLRGPPPFNFVQLYDYLVIKTAKYDHTLIRTSGYKKLKAFQFFKEGHIMRTHISPKGDNLCLRRSISLNEAAEIKGHDFYEPSWGSTESSLPVSSRVRVKIDLAVWKIKEV